LRVEFEPGPEPVDQRHWVAVDARDEGLTGLDPFRDAAVTEAAGDLRAHPVPQPLDRLEVGAGAGPVDDLDAQPGRLRLDDPGDLAGGVVPDQDQPPRLTRAPGHRRPQGVHRLGALAPAVLPPDALPVAEVVRPGGVPPARPLGAVAAPPEPLPAAAPGGAMVQVPVDMHLVHVDQDDPPGADAGEPLEQPTDVGGPLL